MKDVKIKIVLNYLYNLSFQVFSLLVPLITTPYISRVLKAEKIGIYSYTLSISTYFIVAGSLGFPLYGQREISYCAQDVKQRSQKFSEIISGQLFLLMIALSLYYLFVIFFIDEYKSIYFAQSVGIIGGVLATSWFYIGIEEFKVIVIKNFFVKILSVAGLFLLVKSPDDVAVYAFIVGGANVLGNLIILVDIKKYVDFQFNKVRFRSILIHVKPAFILGIPYYIMSIYSIIDKTMLGILGSGYAEVGYYEQSQKIVTFAMAVVTSLGTVLMPRLANEIGNKNHERVISYLNNGIEVSLLIALPMSAGLAVVSPTIIPWFFGVGFEKVGTLLIIFAPMIIIMGISNLIGSQYLVAAKKEKELTISILIGVIINCVFNAILIPEYDSYGAIFATIISESIKLIIQMCLVKEIVPFRNIIHYIYKYGLITGVMAVVIYGLRLKMFFDQTISNTLFLVSVGVIVYVLSLLITKNKYMLKILNIIYSNFAHRL